MSHLPSSSVHQASFLDEHDDVDVSSRGGDNSTASMSRTPKTASKKTSVRRLKDYPNAAALINKLGADCSEHTPVAKQLLEICPPREWVSEEEKGLIHRVLLKTCDLNTIHSSHSLYKQTFRLLKGAIVVAKANNWKATADVEVAIPSHLDIEALRILGSPADGFGTLPRSVHQLLGEAGLQCLAEEPAAENLNCEAFWTNILVQKFQAARPKAQKARGSATRQRASTATAMVVTEDGSELTSYGGHSPQLGAVGDNGQGPSNRRRQRLRLHASGSRALPDDDEDEQSSPTFLSRFGALRQKFGNVQAVQEGGDSMKMFEEDEWQDDDINLTRSEAKAPASESGQLSEHQHEMLDKIVSSKRFTKGLDDALRSAVHKHLPTADFAEKLVSSAPFRDMLRDVVFEAVPKDITDRHLKILEDYGAMRDEIGDIYQDLDHAKKQLDKLQKQLQALSLSLTSSSSATPVAPPPPPPPPSRNGGGGTRSAQEPLKLTESRIFTTPTAPTGAAPGSSSMKSPAGSTNAPPRRRSVMQERDSNQGDQIRTALDTPVRSGGSGKRRATVSPTSVPRKGPKMHQLMNTDA